MKGREWVLVGLDEGWYVWCCLEEEVGRILREQEKLFPVVVWRSNLKKRCTGCESFTSRVSHGLSWLDEMKPAQDGSSLDLGKANE